MELNESNIGIFTKDAEHLAHIDKLIKEAKAVMKPIQDRIKQLIQERKELEHELCNVMEANDLDEAELPNKLEIIEYTCKQAPIPITQKTIKDKMILFFESGPGSELSFNSKKPKHKGLDLHNYIYGKENRDFVKKEQIKSKHKK